MDGNRTFKSDKSKNGKNKRGNDAQHGANDKGFEASSNVSSTMDDKSTSALIIQGLGRKLLFLGVTVGAVYLAMLFSAKLLDSPMDQRTFADADAFVQRRAFEVPCSHDYAKDSENWHDCLPKRCGRIVMDSLISHEEAETMLRIAQKGFALGGSNGGASILDLHSGALSKGDSIINIFRLPQARNLFSAEDFIVFSQVRNKIQFRIAAEFGATPQKLYLTHPTFFSRLTEKPAKTIHDEYWHPHIDKETYETFHYTSLLYLDTHGVNFTGGRFVFADQDANRTVEPRMGRVSMFTSGSENLHFVEKVTSGERHAATIAFTCDRKSAIQDLAAKPNQRNT